MDQLNTLAATFRSPTPELAKQVPRAARDGVVSRLTVWVLELSMDFFPDDNLRQQALQIQELHRQRARGAVPGVGEREYDPSFARDLWPREWQWLRTCAKWGNLYLGDLSQIVWAIAAAAMAINRCLKLDSSEIRLAQRRSQILRLIREINSGSVEQYPQVVSGQLRILVNQEVYILFGHRLQYECVLSRRTRSAKEANLQVEAHLGSLDPYLDWLEERNDDAQHIVGKWLPFM